MRRDRSMQGEARFSDRREETDRDPDLVTVEILDKAEDDLVSGSAFYESPDFIGLGAYFRKLEFDIQTSRYGFMAAFIVLHRNYHVTLSRRFPLRSCTVSGGESNHSRGRWLAQAA